MNAKEFVKKFGWDYARSLVNRLNINDTFYLHGGGEVSVLDIKTLVDAWELVESYGGIKEASKLHYDEFRSDLSWNRLQKAIALVESCTHSN